jgi:hypothetical protein
MSKSLSWTSATSRRPAFHLLRRLAATLLRSGSLVLARAARKLRCKSERAPRLPEIEFHALYVESGAPEGALYVDGELVAVLPVSRL